MVDRTCNMDGCDSKHWGRGLCRTHYNRWYKTGSPHRKGRHRADDPQRLQDRFWSKVEVGHPLGCWEWTGRLDRHGYGHFANGALRSYIAHRFAYQTLMGEIDDGLELDHLCRNRACVNPDHLEPVTHRENMLRSPALKRANEQAACKRGHAYTPENTYISPSKGRRECRMCRRIESRNRRCGRQSRHAG